MKGVWGALTLLGAQAPMIVEFCLGARSNGCPSLLPSLLLVLSSCTRFLYSPVVSWETLASHPARDGFPSGRPQGLPGQDWIFRVASSTESQTAGLRERAFGARKRARERREQTCRRCARVFLPRDGRRTHLLSLQPPAPSLSCRPELTPSFFSLCLRVASGPHPAGVRGADGALPQGGWRLVQEAGREGAREVRLAVRRPPGPEDELGKNSSSSLVPPKGVSRVSCRASR